MRQSFSGDATIIYEKWLNPHEVIAFPWKSNSKDSPINRTGHRCIINMSKPFSLVRHFHRLYDYTLWRHQTVIEQISRLPLQ